MSLLRPSLLWCHPQSRAILCSRNASAFVHFFCQRRHIFSSIISCCLSSNLILVYTREVILSKNAIVVDLIARLQVLVISTYIIMVFFATVTQADSDSWAAARNPKHLAGVSVSVNEAGLCRLGLKYVHGCMDALFLIRFS